MNLQLLNDFLQTLPMEVRTSITEITEMPPDDCEVSAPMAGLGCSNTICLPKQY